GGPRGGALLGRRWCRPPAGTARCLAGDLDWPVCPTVEEQPGVVQEADGLEWPLRLAALWQLLREAPLRRTQQGDFFKRDQERLTQDPRLNGAPAEALAEVPDIAPLTTQLGQLL